jgi:hypothetical protein
MHLSATVAGISSNSAVRGSEMMEINPLFMKQRAGSSLLSPHALTQSPTYTFCIFKIRLVL